MWEARAAVILPILDFRELQCERSWIQLCPQDCHVGELRVDQVHKLHSILLVHSASKQDAFEGLRCNWNKRPPVVGIGGIVGSVLLRAAPFPLIFPMLALGSRQSILCRFNHRLPIFNGHQSQEVARISAWICKGDPILLVVDLSRLRKLGIRRGIELDYDALVIIRIMSPHQ